MEHVREARLVPLRELLREPLHGRPASLHDRPLRQDRGALGGHRDGAVDAARQLARLLDACRSAATGSSSADSTARSTPTARPTARSSGRPTWAAGSSAPPVVVGRPRVLLEPRAAHVRGARVADGRIVWRLPIGKYSPGIATERAYYFTLNGILVAFRGRNSHVEARRGRAMPGPPPTAGGATGTSSHGERRVAPTPERRALHDVACGAPRRSLSAPYAAAVAPAGRARGLLPVGGPRIRARRAGHPRSPRTSAPPAPSISVRQSRTPGRRRLGQPLLVRLVGEIERADVSEHLRLVGEAGERADALQLAPRAPATRSS